MGLNARDRQTAEEPFGADRDPDVAAVTGAGALEGGVAVGELPGLCGSRLGLLDASVDAGQSLVGRVPGMSEKIRN